MFLKSILLFLTLPLLVIVCYFLITYLLRKYENHFETTNPAGEEAD